jgi:hypothetical protein
MELLILLLLLLLLLSRYNRHLKILFKKGVVEGFNQAGILFIIFSQDGIIIIMIVVVVGGGGAFTATAAAGAVAYC